MRAMVRVPVATDNPTLQMRTAIDRDERSITDGEGVPAGMAPAASSSLQPDGGSPVTALPAIGRRGYGSGLMSASATVPVRGAAPRTAAGSTPLTRPARRSNSGG